MSITVNPPELSSEAESARMEAVRRYDVLDTPGDGSFDRITRLASAVLDVPIAIISIVDTDRIWFKSTAGLDGVAEIGRDPGLCASCILQDDTWVVEQADVDPRTLANPLVAGAFGLRFYAGHPLVTDDGFNLGTLCVLDRTPRTFTPEQRAILADLAAVVVGELEVRLSARRAAEETEIRARRVAELNDDVVQVLAASKLALELGRLDVAQESISQALESSKDLLAHMAEDAALLRRTARVLD